MSSARKTWSAVSNASLHPPRSSEAPRHLECAQPASTRIGRDPRHGRGRDDAARLVPAVACSAAVNALALVLAVVSAQAEQPFKMACFNLAASGTSVERQEFYTEHLAEQIQRLGVQVITAKQIRTVLALERQKELLGCADENSTCMAEMSDALGVDAVIAGEIALVEGTYRLSLKSISAKDGRTLATYSAEAPSESALLSELSDGGRTIAAAALGKLRPRTAIAPEALTSAKVPAVRRMAWVPAAAGLALGGAGVYFMLQAQDRASKLQPAGVIPLARAGELRDEGKQFQMFGAIALTTAVAALAGSGAMYFAGSPGEISVMPTASGAAVSVSGVFP